MNRTPSKRSPLHLAAIAVAIAALNMGNQSCEQKQAAQPRVLKMDVRAGAVKALPITMPNGEQVDFPSIASALFFQQIMNSERFVIANSVQPNEPSPPSNSGAAAKPSPSSSKAQKTDREVLERYGFLRPALAAQYASSYRNAARVGTAGEPGHMKAQADMAEKSAAEAGAPLPTCLYELPQAYLSGEVLAFAAHSAVGISVGYGAGPATIGGAIDFTNARLEVSARTDDPLSLQPIAIGSGVGTQEKVNFSFGFPAGVNVGMKFFYQTPVTNTIRKAMTNAINAIVLGYEKMMAGKGGGWSDVWESRVLLDPVIANNDTHVVFRGGYRAGVQLGDSFSVSNIRYAWTGEICESTLKYKIPTSTAPIATATVVSVGDNVSVAKVDYLADVRIEAGAQVKIKSLIQPKPTPSAKR